MALFNMKGRGSQGYHDTNNKWPTIMKMMWRQRISILIFHEVQLPDGDFLNNLREQYQDRAKIIASVLPGRDGTKAAGVIIVVSTENGFTVESTHELLPGRALFVVIRWKKLRLATLAAYTPNNSRENADFWKKISTQYLERNLPSPSIVETEKWTASQPEATNRCR